MLPLLIALFIVGGLLAWELWISEGAHFGRRFVVWLYDLAADRYDRIKQFDMDWEAELLGRPLARLLSELPQPHLLDVGAGTGRTARALRHGAGLAFDTPLGRTGSATGWRPTDGGSRPTTAGEDSSVPLRTDRPSAPGAEAWFPGVLVSLEPSQRMIKLGRERAGAGIEWVRGWAVPLPFGAASFAVVVCLEVLEFTPHPRRTLAEMLRVLRPGGWLLTSNRIGWQAPLIVGRTFPSDRFAAVLRELGFGEVELRPWQVDYDMAWAQKPWV